MSGRDALHGEMPGFAFPGRPGGEYDEPLLDMIFERRPIPPGAPPEMHDLAQMLAALVGPAEPGELAGEAAALRAFRRVAFPARARPAALRPLRRWRSRRPARGRVRLAAALIAAVVGLGGTATAYAGVLPAPIQEMAHITLGAPLKILTAHMSNGQVMDHRNAATEPPAAALTVHRHTKVRQAAEPAVRASQPKRRHAARILPPRLRYA